MVRMLAVFRQFEARTDSSSSSTLRNRFSFSSARGRDLVVLDLFLVCGRRSGKSISSSKWSSRMRDASPTAAAARHAAVRPHLEHEPLAAAAALGSTWKFTRLMGEKSASSRIALMGSASGSRLSAGT